MEVEGWGGWAKVRVTRWTSHQFITVTLKKTEQQLCNKDNKVKYLDIIIKSYLEKQIKMLMVTESETNCE